MCSVWRIVCIGHKSSSLSPSFVSDRTSLGVDITLNVLQYSCWIGSRTTVSFLLGIYSMRHQRCDLSFCI